MANPTGSASPRAAANWLRQELALAEARLDGAPEQAIERARAVITAAPDAAEAYALLGRALARLGRTREAIEVLGHPAAQSHTSADAWRVLGDLLGIVGDPEAAGRAYAQQIRTSVNDPVLRRAALALVDNDLPEAETLLRGQLKAKPTDVAAIRMMAELAARIGRYGDAIKLLRRALELAPGFSAARHNLAIVLYRNNNIDEAIETVDDLIGVDPENPAYHNLAGAVTMKIGAVDRAIGHFERALRQVSDQPKVWMSYGHALKTKGRAAEGVNAYRRALALDPGLGEAWWSLANLKIFRFAGSDIAAMERLLAEGDLDADSRLHVAFALGKAKEDAECFEQAFAHYAEGNRLRREQLPYDADALSDRLKKTCGTISSAFVAERQGQGCLTRAPIFIVGLPRSGSTLVEQILASHPQIEGTQELPDLDVLARRLAGEAAPDYLVRLASLDGPALQALGEEYLERTRIQRSTDRPLFIDKMPNNWQHVAFIRLILPNARIVDVRRHPLACCFSNFKQHFALGQAFSYDLADLGRYYRDYVRMMAHIDKVAPGQVHRVVYEDLIADTEGEVRRLLAYIGVDFSPACLAFYRNDRAVRTASSEQVRQPIFSDGLDQWRHFEAFLAPLKRALGDAADSWAPGG